LIAKVSAEITEVTNKVYELFNSHDSMALDEYNMNITG